MLSSFRRASGSLAGQLHHIHRRTSRRAFVRQLRSAQAVEEEAEVRKFGSTTTTHGVEPYAGQDQFASRSPARTGLYRRARQDQNVACASTPPISASVFGTSA